MEGHAYAAGTIINALATGTGCAFALDLKTKINIIFEEDLKENVVYMEGEQIRNPIVDRVMLIFGRKGVVKIESEIPKGSGLGSSSAFMNALLIALFKATQRELDAHRILTTNARLSLEMGISYTGAFDDAAASLLGGFVVSNNLKMKLLRWERINGEALVLIPPWKRGEILLEEVRKSTKLVEVAVKEAIDGNYRSAMLHNSQYYCKVLNYPFDPIEKALKFGVSAGLSGNGPAYVAFGSRNEIKELADVWRGYGKIRKTKLVSEPSEDVIISDYLFIH